MEEYEDCKDSNQVYPVDFSEEFQSLQHDSLDKFMIFTQVYNKIHSYQDELNDSPELCIISNDLLKLLHKNVSNDIALAGCLVDILCLDLKYAKGDVITLFEEIYCIFNELWCVSELGGIQIQLLKILELIVSVDRGKELFYSKDPTELISAIILYCLKPELVPDSTIILETEINIVMNHNELYRIAALNCLSKILCSKYPLDVDVSTVSEMCKDILQPNSRAHNILKKSSLIFLSTLLDILPEVFNEDYTTIGNVIYFVNDEMEYDFEILKAACSFLKNVTNSEMFDCNMLYDIGVFDTLITLYFKKFDTQDEIARILRTTKRDGAIECIRRLFISIDQSNNLRSCVLTATLFTIISQEQLAHILETNVQQLQTFFDSIEFYSIEQVFVIVDAIVLSIQAIYSYKIVEGIKIIEENIEALFVSLNQICENCPNLQIREGEEKIKAILNMNDL